MHGKKRIKKLERLTKRSNKTQAGCILASRKWRASRRIKRDQNTKQGVRPRAKEFLRILNKQQVTGRRCGRAWGLGTNQQSG